ncbi:MAG: hypothetical protein L0Y60_04360 [Beijerinckiaceae bacterium]|nr:hypothetical protein [Beijerinckiaceae bacterium]
MSELPRLSFDFPEPEMSNPILVFILGFLLIAAGFALVLRGFPVESGDEFMGSTIERFDVTPLRPPPDGI